MWVPGVQSLIARGAKVNAVDTKGRTPLMHAIQQGSMPNFTRLVDSGADITFATRDATPVHRAVHHGRHAMVNALLARGVDVNARAGLHQRTALHVAAKRGDVAIVQALVEHGARVNAVDGRQSTPLLDAAGCVQVKARYGDCLHCTNLCVPCAAIGVQQNL